MKRREGVGLRSVVEVAVKGEPGGRGGGTTKKGSPWEIVESLEKGRFWWEEGRISSGEKREGEGSGLRRNTIHVILTFCAALRKKQSGEPSGLSEGRVVCFLFLISREGKKVNAEGLNSTSKGITHKKKRVGKGTAGGLNRVGEFNRGGGSCM